ncbi:hypothetical protein MAFF212519_21710 [Clavibacter michiganensis]
MLRDDDRVVDVHLHDGHDACYPCVAGRRDELVARVLPEQGRDDGVLSRTGTEYQDLHAPTLSTPTPPVRAPGAPAGAAHPRPGRVGGGRAEGGRPTRRGYGAGRLPALSGVLRVRRRAHRPCPPEAGGGRGREDVLPCRAGRVTAGHFHTR